MKRVLIALFLGASVAACADSPNTGTDAEHVVTLASWSETVGFIFCAHAIAKPAPHCAEVESECSRVATEVRDSMMPMGDVDTPVAWSVERVEACANAVATMACPVTVDEIPGECLP